MTRGVFGPELSAQWTRVRGGMRAEYGEKAYGSWIKPLTLSELQGEKVRLAVPTRFMRDWVEEHYLEILASLWRAENAAVKAVEIIVEPTPVRDPAAPGAADSTEPESPEAPGAGAAAAAEPAPAPAAAAVTTEQEDRDYVSSAILDPRLTFANFVVGPSNELAHAAARRVAEAKGVPFNPLFLYSGVGLGKTHLMNAIAWHIRELDPTRRVALHLRRKVHVRVHSRPALPQRPGV